MEYRHAGKTWLSVSELRRGAATFGREPTEADSHAMLGRYAVVLFFLVFLVSAQAASGAPCSDPLSVTRAFYDSNDAHHFAAAAGSLANDALFDTWATGVNGYIMAKRHLKGRAAIQKYLPEARGVRWHLPDSPSSGPVYSLTRASVTADVVKFMLVPDRKRPGGRPYNPFSIEARVSACRIVSLTVIEQVTWL